MVYQIYLPAIDTIVTGMAGVGERELGRRGGYVGGFIDDVVKGKRIVVDRPAKEFP